ncbi:hypothetical protein EFA46_015905 (plasmid) [Halarchaeum sp. CBA1220]|uniref:hypothetical protein n=1 Tax=Halarchaeum sp. CBA1220 TaxID=1853682 RepID=UPI000F3A9F9D|nr:hypothetical protein [Halarchaeum sp. CBA1220]QLC35742.1 hypothetical protein EFA46_015905 [Halarchaeum sp. CBA1220]
MSERVLVGVRVPESIKTAYEDALLEEYVQTRPYAGTELETELRVALGIGEDAAMFDTLRGLRANWEEEKNNSAPSFSGGEKTVNYRIDPTVRAELKRASQDGDDTMGEIVARVMYHYAVGDGYQDRMRALVADVAEDGVDTDEDDEGDDLDATERRAGEIAGYIEENAKQVREGVIFDVADFNEAVREGCSSLSPSDYARETYLKPVLDRLGCKPTASGNFVPSDAGAIADLRGLPYECMSDEDVVDAIKAAALEDRDSRRRQQRFTATDAKNALGGRPRKDTVRRHMEQIGRTEGFTYHEGGRSIDEAYLTVSGDVLHADWAHDRALKMAGLLDQGADAGNDVDDDFGAGVRTPMDAAEEER